MPDTTTSPIEKRLADHFEIVHPPSNAKIEGGDVLHLDELTLVGRSSRTNDAGIQEGKDWFYSWNVIFGAIDAQSQKMAQGRLALVLTK